MKKDLISIIIPFYNSELFILKCVDSAIGQDYDNLEIILVDDGSPDNCGKICDNYAAVDRRVKAIHQKNRGTSAAYNAGLKKASGAYVTFIDGDDWVEQSYCGLLYENAEKFSAEISCCGHFAFRGNEAKPAIIEKTEVYSNLEAIERVPAPPWGKLYKKALFDGLEYPVNRQPGDLFLTYKVLYRAKKVAETSAMLYNYYKRPDSVMGLKPRVEHLAVLDAYEEKIAFLQERGHAAIAARIKKLLVATIAGFKVFFEKNRKHYGKDALDLIKGKMRVAARQCAADAELSLLQKTEVFMYEHFTGFSVLLASLKRGLNDRINGVRVGKN